MNAIEQKLAEALLANEITALRFAAGQERQVEAAIADLKATARRILAQERISNTTIETLGQAVQRAFDSLSSSQMAALQEFLSLASGATITVLNGELGIDLFKRPNRLPQRADQIILDGSPVRIWWAKQADNTREAFAREIRTGFASGETTDEIARRVIGKRGEPAILDVSLRQARSLAHTSVMAVANEAVEEVFQANDDVVKGVTWLSTLDSRTCTFCAPRDQKNYTLDHRPSGHDLPWGSGPGSAHMNCRCTRTPWLRSWKDLGLDIEEFEPSTRASANGPVSGNLTFESWIDSRPASVQREWFGPGRYELYRDGKITLRDLTDMRGRELTLEQLRQKFG